MITPAERQEWEQRTAPDRPDEEAMSDPLWRLRWLYTIKDKAGKIVPFEPVEEQIEVLISVYVRGWQRILIPKARQLGMSTVLALICLDFCLFTAGFAAALIDKTGSDAEEKLRDKVKLAWEQQTPEFRAAYTLPAGYAPAGIGWKLGDDVASSFKAGISARGGTLQLLWISEWGWIQANDATRSSEILTGSLPAAENGIIIVETTWEGGEAGDVWPLVCEALEAKEEDKGPKTWRILFFPWWTSPDYSLDFGYVDDVSAKYLDKIEQELATKFTSGQRKWYAGKRRTMPRKIKNEYPSTLKECWEGSIDGAIYGDEMATAQIEGRIGEFRVDGRVPVHTSWDLGSALHTVVWYWQKLPGGIFRIVDIDYALDLNTLKRAEWMKAKGYTFGTHYLPHDAKQERMGSTFENEWRALSIQFNLGTVQRVPAIFRTWEGIDYMRKLLPSLEFRMPATAKGVSGLKAYRRHQVKDNAVLKDEPVHDWASHIADGLRTMAEAEKAGMVKTGGNEQRSALATPIRAKMGLTGL